jgi:hypothetical protein
MMTFTFEWALAICVGIYLIGSLVSTKTKAKLPTMFVVSILFLIGYWTILPKDIIVTSGIKIVSDIGFLVVLIHVGTLFEFEELKKEWRVVATVLSAILGICVLVLVGIPLFFNKEIAFCSIPSLVGGGIATIIMTQAANAKGNTQAALLATMILTMQTMIGFPLTSLNLKKEMLRLLPMAHKNETLTAEANITEVKKVYWRDRIPGKYKDTTYHLFCCVILGALSYWIGNYTAAMTGNLINRSLLAIIFGIIMYSLGIIDKEPLTKAGAFPFLMFALTLNLMSSLSAATPALLFQTIVPLSVAFALATLSIWFISPLVGKKFGYTAAWSRALSFNCFLGYPFNHQITLEAINAVATDSEGRKYLEAKLLPSMIIGGVVAVSIISVVVSGIFSGLL